MNKEMYGEFLAFIKERENIRIKKENGETHLTDDPILAKYSFTNVRRMDDKGTKFIHAHINTLIKNGATHADLRKFIYFAVRTSMTGINILADLDYDFEKYIQHCNDNHKIYRQGAYFVSFRWDGFVEKSMANLKALEEDRINDVTWCKMFMRNQMTTYYREIYQVHGIKISKHIDFYGFNPEIGTGKGLKFLELPLKNESVYELFDNVSKDLPEVKLNDINDISNCLCEFSKYKGYQVNPKRRMRSYHGKN